MKKIIIILIIVFAILSIIALSLTLFKSNDGNIVNNQKSESVSNNVSSFLTLMLETEAGSGEYEKSTTNTWPEDDYIFNSELSGCENGGELSWNEELNTVNLITNSSDACYVYFDLYIKPVINSVEASNITTDSITLTVNATNGNNEITSYYYSKDNGSSYETSNSNTYTFSGLDISL